METWRDSRQKFILRRLLEGEHRCLVCGLLDIYLLINIWNVNGKIFAN